MLCNTQTEGPIGSLICLFLIFPVSMVEVRVEAESEGPEGVLLAFHVVDTGRGIPAEHLRHLFTPFYSLRHTGRGTGLGLALCQRLAALLPSGRISLQSAPDRGTRATFRARFRAAVAPPLSSALVTKPLHLVGEPSLATHALASLLPRLHGGLDLREGEGAVGVLEWAPETGPSFHSLLLLLTLQGEAAAWPPEPLLVLVHASHAAPLNAHLAAHPHSAPVQLLNKPIRCSVLGAQLRRLGVLQSGAVEGDEPQAQVAPPTASILGPGQAQLAATPAFPTPMRVLVAEDNALMQHVRISSSTHVIS